METIWEGRGTGRCFELPPAAEVLAPSARSLDPIRAGAFGDEMPAELRERLAGPLSGIAEQLSAALRLDVLVAYVSDNPPNHVVVVWQAGVVERVQLSAGDEGREWPAPWPAVSQVRPETFWEADVEGFLATRPLSQSPGGGGGDIGDLAVDFAGSVVVRSQVEKAVVFAVLMACAGLVWMGMVVGEQLGHPDLGGTIAFVAMLLVLAGACWKLGIVRLPADGMWNVAAVGGAGVLLVVAGRSMVTPFATAAVGGTGVALVVGAALRTCWMVFRGPDRDPDPEPDFDDY